MRQGFARFAILCFIPAAAAAQSPPSVRVATYNAFLLSPAFRCANVNAADCVAQTPDLTKQWADKLAAALLADSAGLDIIVINEAWDEDAKEALAQALAGVYPLQIRDIDAPTIDLQRQAVAGLPGGLRALLPISFAGEDSGLMLFAKSGFSALPLPGKRYRWGDEAGEEIKISGATSAEVAFTRFSDCAIADCLAAKGAALVRLRHDASGHVFNVAFTHMQADDFKKALLYPGVRRRQFAQIEQMVRTTLTSRGRFTGAGQSLLLMGDLNVVGDPRPDTEFSSLFVGRGSFYATTLAESWSWTSDIRDRTPTNRNDRVRLDYILTSIAPLGRSGLVRPVEPPVCVQHLTVPVRYRHLESDHHMVAADLNAREAHCSPATARVVTMPPVGTRATFVLGDPSPRGPSAEPIEIARPGGMQWFRIDAPEWGTYTIGPDDAAFRVDVFAPEDMSIAWSRYNVTPGVERPQIGAFRLPPTDQYLLPPTFYVRIVGGRRGLQEYRLLIHRHNCASREDACLVAPGTEASALLSRRTPPNGQVGRQDEAWFRYDVKGTALSGVPQKVTLSTWPILPNLQAAIESHADPAALPAPAPRLGDGKRVFEGPASDGGRGYLVIRQSQPGDSDTKVTASMASSLRLLTVHRLVCHDETNPELGSDEIFTAFRVDGTTYRVPPTGNLSFDCDEPEDSKDWSTPTGSASVMFADTVDVQVSEFGGLPDATSDWRRVADPEYLNRQKSIEWRFEGGIYRLFYDVVWRKQEPVADFVGR